MNAPSKPVISPEWNQAPDQESKEENAWLNQAGRFSLVRTHIGVFAVGSVALLALNLLLGSSGIWADTWIISWGILLIIHAVIAGIASLLLQLLAEDDIRPASEVRWDPLRTWTAPLPDRTPVQADPVDANWLQPATPEPQETPQKQPQKPKNEEKVSWTTATEAAWLARPAKATQEEFAQESSSPSDDPSTGP